MVFRFDADRLIDAADEAAADDDGVAAPSELPLLWEAHEQDHLLTVLKFSPDETLLAAAGHQRVVDVFKVGAGGDGEGWRRVAQCHGHSGTILHLDWAADSSMFQTSSADYDLLCWDRRGRQLMTNQRDKDWATQNVPLGWNVMGACRSISLSLSRASSPRVNAFRNLPPARCAESGFFRRCRDMGGGYAGRADHHRRRPLAVRPLRAGSRRPPTAPAAQLSSRRQTRPEPLPHGPWPRSHVGLLGCGREPRGLRRRGRPGGLPMGGHASGPGLSAGNHHRRRAVCSAAGGCGGRGPKSGPGAAAEDVLDDPAAPEADAASPGGRDRTAAPAARQASSILKCCGSVCACVCVCGCRQGIAELRHGAFKQEQTWPPWRPCRLLAEVEEAAGAADDRR